MIHHSILFVDDDVLTHWVTSEILSEAGYDVVGASRGCDAIRLLHDAPEFDVLLTDVDLPDSLTGTDLGQLWRELLPGRPIVYTGMQRPLAARHLTDQEFFLVKPFTPARLLATLFRGLQKARTSSPPSRDTRRVSLYH